MVIGPGDVFRPRRVPLQHARDHRRPVAGLVAGLAQSPRARRRSGRSAAPHPWAAVAPCGHGDPQAPVGLPSGGFSRRGFIGRARRSSPRCDFDHGLGRRARPGDCTSGAMSSNRKDRLAIDGGDAVAFGEHAPGRLPSGDARPITGGAGGSAGRCRMTCTARGSSKPAGRCESAQLRVRLRSPSAVRTSHAGCRAIERRAEQRQLRLAPGRRLARRRPLSSVSPLAQSGLRRRCRRRGRPPARSPGGRSRTCAHSSTTHSSRFASGPANDDRDALATPAGG